MERRIRTQGLTSHPASFLTHSGFRNGSANSVSVKTPKESRPGCLLNWQEGPQWAGLGWRWWLALIAGLACVWQVKASSYMQLTCCLLGSSYLSTVGLDYINYPTKVVFRSCKLIPTMAVALVMNRERFSLTDITCAVAICVGLALFALADMTSVSKVSTAFGMALQASSTVADAFLPNLQQALFKQGASTLEVTYYTNLYVFFIMTLMGGGSGHLHGAWTFVRANGTNGLHLLLYSVVAYWAINFHIRVVQRYGSVVAVLVGNLRKAGTIALSFVVFPKPFSWFYVAGTVLVFGGLTITAYVKDQKRRCGFSCRPATRTLPWHVVANLTRLGGNTW